MNPSDWYQLAGDAGEPARPFTDPRHIQHDYIFLNELLNLVRAVMRQADDEWAHQTTQRTILLGHDQQAQRLIINNPAQLLRHSDFVVVGFFGQRRAQADTLAINEMDGVLVQELSKHPGILVYCSAPKIDGDYGNLILFASHTAMQALGASQAHAHAAQVLSPGYYQHVRIHDGLLAGSLHSTNRLVLRRTRYWDFASSGSWRAVRELAQGFDGAFVAS